ncbi:MAG: GAF domain-containing protein [Acidobacteria bacterium]|nr:GAF domain-containing protein [Acidobacteriota bacterium]
MEKQICYFEDSPAAGLAIQVADSYPRVSVPRGARREQLGQVATVWLADGERDARDLEALGPLDSHLRIICLVGADHLEEAPLGQNVFAYLPLNVPPTLLRRTIASAFENLELRARALEAERQLGQSAHEIDELNRIGIALSSERDPQALLNLILQKSREITASDAGSLYLIEEISENERRLRFKLTQNDSVPVSFTEFTMPLNTRSIAGYVAVTGEVLHLADVYELPAGAPYGFNRRFDEESGYRTKSMLTIPMKNQKGDTLGVLQLINCKRRWEAQLAGPEEVEREVIPYSQRRQELASSLASQAAVAYQNSVLYENIQTLFEGFVKAAVTAIEQRDPTTSGHSFRVARLTCGLAEVVDKVDAGPYASLRFSREQMKELRYAALLHDFGKVAVREEVLVKARKLYPLQLEIIRQRFDYIRKALEADYSRRKLDYVLRTGQEETLRLLDEEFELRLAELDDYLHFILEVNEPSVLPQGNFEKLLEVAQRTYRDPRGVEHNYIKPDEVRYLSIPQGSLDPEERKQIESHVEQSFLFLRQIPWNRETNKIPMIARAHHELLNGSGYPFQLRGEQIPPQTRMMTVADIFDALSAADRPYKKAVPVEEALTILGDMVKQGQLDPLLFELFVNAKIYQLTAKTS